MRARWICTAQQGHFTSLDSLLPLESAFGAAWRATLLPLESAFGAAFRAAAALGDAVAAVLLAPLWLGGGVVRLNRTSNPLVACRFRLGAGVAGAIWRKKINRS